LIAGFSHYQQKDSKTFILKRLALFQLGRKAYSNEQMQQFLGHEYHDWRNKISFEYTLPLP
jgi:hypothetical protein